MDIFSVFFNMKVCCVFSLESPHRGDSNEFTQYTIFNIKKKITLNYPKSADIGFCAKELKNEFESAMVNEPSVFEPLKFYCILEHQKFYKSVVHFNILGFETDKLLFPLNSGKTLGNLNDWKQCSEKLF